MMSRFALIALFISATMATALAQPSGNVPTAPENAAEHTQRAPAVDGPATMPTEITLDAYDAVREGNRLLRAGQAQEALRLYEHADQLHPEAREIAFAEGLSRYALGEYEQARESLQRVSLGKVDALADDAIYSEGASYHAEALSAMDNPELALSQLESAMQRYQTVLAKRPEHEAAKDANYKAAHAWRQIKQMMQQQEQQEQQQGDDQNDEQQQQDQDQQQEKDENDQQQEQEPNESDQQQDQQQEQKQQGDQEQKDEQQQQQEQAEQEESEQQPQQSQQEHDVSREQAERKLREMMQAQRQRQKNRKKQRALVPVRPTEKDW